MGNIAVGKVKTVRFPFSDLSQSIYDLSFTRTRLSTRRFFSVAGDFSTDFDTGESIVASSDHSRNDSPGAAAKRRL